MERLWREHGRTSVAVPVGLVRGWTAHADADRAHDPHPAHSIHPEPCRHAGDPADCQCHGDRRLSAILAARRACRTGAAADVVLPMARRNPAELLHPDATGEAPLHPAVWSMAVIPAVPSPRRGPTERPKSQLRSERSWATHGHRLRSILEHVRCSGGGLSR